jgi:hypothetical protein
MSNSLTLAQCDRLQEIRRLIQSIILTDVDDDAIAAMMKLVNRRWREFVKERETPVEAPARH